MGHEIQTVQALGLAGLTNGALLHAVSDMGFDVFLTVDQGIAYQQVIPNLNFAIVALRARSNDIADLRPLVPEILQVLGLVRPGTLMRVPRA